MEMGQKRNFTEYLTLIFLKDRQVSKPVFNLVVGLVLMWGFLLNYWIVQYFPTEWLTALNLWVFLLLYFVMSGIGVGIMLYYEMPLFSFIGYSIMTSTLGFLLNIYLEHFSGEEVIRAIQYTAWTTFGMIIAATLLPKLFLRLHTILVVIVSSVAAIEFGWIILFGQSGDFFHWIIAISMCGYIGYHWADMKDCGDTLDQAIDFGGLLYLAIINLFIRILELLRLSK